MLHDLCNIDGVQILVGHQLPDVVNNLRHIIFVPFVLLISSLIFIITFKVSQTSDAIIHELQRLINILLLNLGSEMEFGHGLGDSDDSEECSGGDIHVAYLIISFSLEFSFFHVLCHNVIVKLSRNIWVVGLSMRNEGTHRFSFNSPCILVDRCLHGLMDLCDMLG